MVELQILSKIINEGQTHILEKNGLTAEYFPEYIEEYSFILNHQKEHGKVPDEATFQAKFPNFTILDVKEPEKYLIETIEEEQLYARTVPILSQCADLLQTDSIAAAEYLQSKLSELTPKAFNPGVDLVAQAEIRYEEWLERQSPDSDMFIPSSFDLLDDITGGWRRGEELVVVFARTGNGKTFVMLEILRSAWQLGNTIGLVEPEMSANSVGYRFDTLHCHISNKALYRGYGADAYKNHIEALQENEIPFWVASPRDFGGKVTVQKLKSWVTSNNIQVLAIDGISYMSDERAERNDSRQAQLTHISEDLMQLSIELGIPIFIVSQANRSGATQDAPSVDSIRDADGISYNASIILSLKSEWIGEDRILSILVGKSRNGQDDVKIRYNWDVDKGLFSERLDDDEEGQQERPIPKREERPRPTGASNSRVQEQF